MRRPTGVVTAVATQSAGRATRRVLLGLTGVVAIFAVLLLATPRRDGLPTHAQDAMTLGLSVLIEALPFIALGVLLSIVVQVWLPAGVLEKALRGPAWLRRMQLSLLGMFVPVCECGNVPFARGLMMRGLSPAEALTFLMAAPIVNPIVIITTHAAFGFDDGILVARLLGGFAIANLIGWLYSRDPNPETLLTRNFVATCEQLESETGTKLQRSFSQLIIELRAVMPALVLGSALAGLVQVFVPRDWLIAIGANPVASIAVMMVLAIIVAICSNVDAFFALSFASTFSPGAIVTFLVVGPLVDVKMVALLRTTFTTRAIAGIIGVVITAAFALGLAVNLVG